MRRDQEFWKSEAAYIARQRREQPGKNFNFDPACFERYVAMQANFCVRDGFPILAQKIQCKPLTESQRLDLEKRIAADTAARVRAIEAATWREDIVQVEAYGEGGRFGTSGWSGAVSEFDRILSGIWRDERERNRNRPAGQPCGYTKVWCKVLLPDGAVELRLDVDREGTDSSLAGALELRRDYYLRKKDRASSDFYAAALGAITGKVEEEDS